MPVLTTKILKEITSTFFLILLILTVISVLPMADRFCKDISFTAIIELIPIIALSSFRYTVPIAAIVACTMFSSRYKSDRQYIAMASSGVSLRAAFRPIVAFFFLISTLHLYASHNLIPNAWNKLFSGTDKHMAQLFVNKASSGLPVVISYSERLFTESVDKSNKELPVLKGVTYSKVVDDKISIINAESATVVVNDEKNYVVTFYDTVIEPLSDASGTLIPDKDAVSEFIIIDRTQIQIVLDLNKRKKKRRKGEWALTSRELNVNNLKHKLTPDELVTMQMFATGQANSVQKEKAVKLMAEKKDAIAVVEMKIEYINRWLDGLVIPIFAWLGLWLGLYLPWPHKATAFVLSLLPYGFYYSLIPTFRAQIIKEGLPIWILYFALVIIAFPSFVFIKKCRILGYK